MDAPLPIACTLSPAAYADRGGAWRAVLTSELVSWERRPDGVRLLLGPAAEDRVRELVALEAECCDWFHATVTRGDVVTVDLVARGDGPMVLHAMFDTFAQGG